MSKVKPTLEIPTDHPPKVLLLGNGMLKLSAGGSSWDDLLQKIKLRPGEISTKGIPYAMQPEALCGVDVDEVQRRTAENIRSVESHPLLRELLSLPFDAILTTNYTYEIEETLSGKPWTETRRRNSFIALDGHPHVRHNTFICSLVKTADGRTVPVFHIHGEKLRKHSMTLSYYSYADSLSRLVKYNKELGNDLQELQQEGKSKACRCWLDWFLLGDVCSVGFGFDPSEFDLWWAAERKAREKAIHGKLTAFMEDDPKKYSAPATLFGAMDADCRIISIENGYEEMYRTIIEQIKQEL